MSSNIINLSTYYLKKEEIENAFRQDKRDTQAIKNAIDTKSDDTHIHRNLQFNATWCYA